MAKFKPDEKPVFALHHTWKWTEAENAVAEALAVEFDKMATELGLRIHYVYYYASEAYVYRMEPMPGQRDISIEVYLDHATVSHLGRSWDNQLIAEIYVYDINPFSGQPCKRPPRRVTSPETDSPMGFISRVVEVLDNMIQRMKVSESARDVIESFFPEDFKALREALGDELLAMCLRLKSTTGDEFLLEGYDIRRGPPRAHGNEAMPGFSIMWHYKGWDDEDEETCVAGVTFGYGGIRSRPNIHWRYYDRQGHLVKLDAIPFTAESIYEIVALFEQHIQKTFS